MAAHDHTTRTNSRFEALLECDAAAVCGTNASVLHLPISIVQQYQLRTGDRIQLRAALLPAHLRRTLPFAHTLLYDVLHNATDVELLVRPSSPPPSESVRKRGAGTQVAVDLRRIALILLTLGGHQLECSRSHIENLVWDGNAEGNSVLDIFETTTYGKKTIAADVDADGKHDVFGPFSITYDGTCNYRSWKEQADQAANTAGIELSIFQHRIYVLPFFRDLQGLCSWRGLGDFGCHGPCHVWTLSCGELQTYVHELGHNFELAHAASFYNEEGTVVEYGDPTAVMGNHWFGKNWISNFNAPHKDSIGWFEGTNKAQEIPHNADGIYALSPLDDFSQNTVASQLIKIRHEYTGNVYYFSYNGHSSDGMANQLLVQVFVNRTSPTLFVRSLIDGDTFVDFQHRFAVTQLDVNSTVLHAHVQFGCNIASPHVEIAVVDRDLGARRFENGSTFDMARGRDLALDVFITNRNSPLCLPSNYSFSTQVTSAAAAVGWHAEVDSVELVLASHQTCSVRWTLLPAAGSNTSAATAPVDVDAFGASLLLNVTHGDPGSYTDGPVLHNISVNIRHPPACARAPPRFVVLDAWQQTHHLEPTVYSFEISNDDALLCPPAHFVVNVTVDATYWNASIEIDTFSVAASAVVRGSLKLVPLARHKSSSSAFTVARLTLSSLETPAPAEHKPVTTEFDVLTCVASPPVIYTAPDELMLEARSSTGTRVYITNADSNCVPTVWAFDYTDIERPMHINLLPSTVQLASGQHGSVLVLFTAPTVGVVPFLRTNITVWDLHDTTRNATTSLSLTSYDVPCALHAPVVNVACPRHVDPVMQRSFDCKIIIENHDSWPCIRRTMVASVINVPRAWGWDDTMLQWDATKADVPVDGSVWLTLTAHVPRTFADRFNATALGARAFTEVSWSVAVNLTSEATPIGQVYASPDIYFGTCTNLMPTITVSVAENDTLVVPLNGSGDVSIDVQNHNGVYCDDESHYDVKLDPPSLSRGLQGGVGSVDVKRARSGTAHWRFSGALAGVYDVSLTVANRENVSLITAPYLFRVEVNATCIVRQPTMKLLSPFKLPSGVELPFRQPNTSYVLHEPLRLPAGRALEANFTVVVTNNDSPGCPDTPYRIFPDFSMLPNPNYYYYHSAPYANAWHYDESILRVPANSTQSAAIRVYVDKSASAQQYPISIAIAGDHTLHSSSVVASFDIACPQPAAVYNITSSQYTPAFKLERSVLLQWSNPCPNTFLCCCPCSFHVERDGVPIGKIDTSLSNFTFNFTDTEVVNGQTSVYSVYVVDRLNRTSAEADTCSHDITVVVGAADKELFIAFFSGTLGGMVVVVALFAALFVWLVRRQREKYDVKFGTGKHAGKWRDALVDINEATFARVNAANLSSSATTSSAGVGVGDTSNLSLPVSLLVWKPTPLTRPGDDAQMAPTKPARRAPAAPPAVAAAVAATSSSSSSSSSTTTTKIEADEKRHDDPLRSDVLIDLSDV
jgi:hypothetical protein